MHNRLCILFTALFSTTISLVAEDFETAGKADKEEDEVVFNQTTFFELGNATKLQGDFLPYYQYANQHGVLSPSGSQTYNRGVYNFHLSKEKLSLEAGADLYFYYLNKEQYYSHHFHLQQLYVKGNWGKYSIQLGSKEEDGEFVPTLSSGNLLWSGNTRPSPTLRIGTDDFVSTFITGNLFEVKCNFWWSKQTDGWYNRKEYGSYEESYALDGYVSHYYDNITDNRQHSKVENAWFHRKSFFVRSTIEKPVFFTIGFEHAVMYGGTVNNVNCSEPWNWLRGMLGGSGKKAGNQFNHAFTQNYRVDWRSDKIWIGLYKQHYSDDLDGGLFSTGADGLWGVEVALPKYKWVKNIVVEYLQTTNQGGVVYANDVYTKLGSANRVYRTAGNSNFYHDQHMGAWTHYGMILGNPLLASPIYNSDSYPDMASNMIRALHFAISGNLTPNLTYVLKFQHTDSWGTPYAPFGQIKSNTSFSIAAKYKINDSWLLNGSIALDRGSLYGNNSGLCINVQYAL